VTSFKAYTQITRDELRAAVKEAHRRGLKVTGHLCSVTYDEAVEGGDRQPSSTGFSRETRRSTGGEKQPDTCSDSAGDETLEQMKPGAAATDRLIAMLVGHHVCDHVDASGRAASTEGKPLRTEILEAMAPGRTPTRIFYARPSTGRPIRLERRAALLLRREMDLERAFRRGGGAAAGGTGSGRHQWGLFLAFSDHRQIELLVEPGSPPVSGDSDRDAERCDLSRPARIRSASIAVGKNADLVCGEG